MRKGETQKKDDMGGSHLFDKGGYQAGYFLDKVATKNATFLSKGGYQKCYFFDKDATKNDAFLSKGANQDSDDIYLKRQVIEHITGLSRAGITKACRSGGFKYIIVYGNGGRQYRIALSSLPPDAQIKWILDNPQQAKGLPAFIIDKLSFQAQWEIAKLNAPVLMANNEILLNEEAKERLSKKMEFIQKALSVPSSYKRSAWIARIADEAGITKQSLYRAIRNYKNGGINTLIKPRKKKGPCSWSMEAIEYMQGIYLKAIREGGDANKLNAYQATIAKAKRENWQIGSKSSAYDYLTKLNPLLERYARGGVRALDNIFYIIRQYDDLAPFEIIVGDQHRFDFFVHDREHNKIFRPEGYFWVDLKTRLTYGFAISERYDSYLMGLALRMGLKRFGKFGCAYTDNGKPEISRYITEIINDLKVYGMQQKDIAELYKTDNGYVIEDDKDEVIDVVPSAAAWRKFARPYNAKAKLIERFFKTIEKILLGLGIPGHIRELKGTSEEKAISDMRLKGLIEEDKLLSPEEFIIKVFEAVEIYEHRQHAGIKKPPMDALIDEVKEGFTPKMIIEPEIDFILLKRDNRSVNRGRIRIDGILYEGYDLSHGLWDVPDKTKIEVRYDPIEPDKCIAIKPDNTIVNLQFVTISSMKDAELTSALMDRKRRFIAEIKEHYRKLTAPIKGVIEYSKYTKSAINLKKQKSHKPVERLTPEEYERRVNEAIKDNLEYEKRFNEPRPLIPSIIPERSIFKDDYDRYKYIIHRMLAGYELTSSDYSFKERYEANMDDSERIWWEEFIKHNQYQKGRAVC